MFSIFAGFRKENWNDAGKFQDYIFAQHEARWSGINCPRDLHLALIAPCKEGFWIFTLWIPDSWSVEYGFRIAIISGIPDSLRCILYSKAQDSGFLSKNLLDSELHKQKFPDSGILYMEGRVVLESSRYWKHCDLATVLAQLEMRHLAVSNLTALFKTGVISVFDNSFMRMSNSWKMVNDWFHHIVSRIL